MKMILLRYYPVLWMGFWFFIASGFYDAEVFAQQKMHDGKNSSSRDNSLLAN